MICSTDGWMDGQMDKVKPVYPLSTSLVEGIKANFRHYRNVHALLL